MSLVSKSGSVIRTALSGMRRSPFAHTLAICIIAIGLFGVGLVRAGLSWTNEINQTLNHRLLLTAYLEEGASTDEADAVKAWLDARKMGTATVVTPAQAMQRLSSELGDLGGVLQNLPNNPLPLSVELPLPDGLKDVDAVEALAVDLKRVPHVADVDYGKEAVGRFRSISRAARWVGWLALLLTAFAALVVISAMLELGIYARREEIVIQKLVGATHRYVRAPFILEGALQGFAGALLASVLLWVVSQTLWPRLTELLSFLMPDRGTLALWSPRLASELFIAGVVLGVMGSVVAVSRRLKT